MSSNVLNFPEGGARSPGEEESERLDLPPNNWVNAYQVGLAILLATYIYEDDAAAKRLQGLMDSMLTYRQMWVNPFSGSVTQLPPYLWGDCPGRQQALEQLWDRFDVIPIDMQEEV